MEKRLKYNIKITNEARKISFPSMLIQPVVENAIKHGLEPKVNGGRIDISVDICGEKLIWKIVDTGIGMSEMDGLGIGLSNVIERLDSLFGSKAELQIEENTPTGTIVTIEVPYE
jgi:LytS/YehU family sensor histidine kinase